MANSSKRWKVRCGHGIIGSMFSLDWVRAEGKWEIPGYVKLGRGRGSCGVSCRQYYNRTFQSQDQDDG